MLNADGSARNPIEICGIFPFDVTVRISDLSWNYISAYKKNKMEYGNCHTPYNARDVRNLRIVFGAPHRNLLETSVNGFFGYM